MEFILGFIIISLLSLLGYSAKRVLDIVEHLVGKDNSVNARPVLIDTHKEENKNIDEIPLSGVEYAGEGSVVAEHVAERHARAQEKADELRAELAQYTQHPNAGVYDVPNQHIDSTYIPRPTEEYAK